MLNENTKKLKRYRYLKQLKKQQKYIDIETVVEHNRLKKEIYKYLDASNSSTELDHSEKIEKTTNRLFNKKINQFQINSINDFHNSIKQDYSLKNEKQLQYLINRLFYLRSDSGEYIFKIQDYLKYMNVDNDFNITGVKNDISFLKGKDSVIANKQFSKVKYLEHHNKNKIPVFLTLTCPSQYHYFTSKHNGVNPNCVFNTLGESIENSFIFQKDLNRELYKNLKKKLSRKKLNTSFDFIRMFETHNKNKNLTIHSHSVFYVDLNQYLMLQSVYNDLISKYNLLQTKMIILENIKSSSYVMKYIIKNLDLDSNSNNQDNFYNELKRYYFNHKLFTASNYKDTTQAEINKVYNHLKKDRPKLLEKFKKSNVPLYVNIEKYILKNLEVEYEEVEVNKTQYINTKSKINDILKKTENYINLVKKYNSSKLDLQLVYSKVITNKKYILSIKKSLKQDIKTNTSKIKVKQIKSIKYKNSNSIIYEAGNTFLDFDKTNVFKKQGLIK